MTEMTRRALDRRRVFGSVMGRMPWRYEQDHRKFDVAGLEVDATGAPVEIGAAEAAAFIPPAPAVPDGPSEPVTDPLVTFRINGVPYGFYLSDLEGKDIVIDTPARPPVATEGVEAPPAAPDLTRPENRPDRLVTTEELRSRYTEVTRKTAPVGWLKGRLQKEIRAALAAAAEPVA